MIGTGEFWSDIEYVIERTDGRDAMVLCESTLPSTRAAAAAVTATGEALTVGAVFITVVAAVGMPAF